jgi:uncharacterized NAD(P)/FAD-binding protein YdhS
MTERSKKSFRALPRTVAIVGTGPTALYTLLHLIEAREPLTITLFETSNLAGVGLPYGPKATEALMLANIASIEIPPIDEPYLDWLARQPASILAAYGTTHDQLHDRQFLPRLLLGGWLRDRLLHLVSKGASQGHRIAISERTRVVDVELMPGPTAAPVRLTFRKDAKSLPEAAYYTHVVLATGHSWPDDPSLKSERVFVSPWSGLLEANITAGEVGIIGTSLSAIDAAIAVACQHGHFEGSGADLRFTVKADSRDLRITLMSRQGLLPEADFWCPLPYLPLQYVTKSAVHTAIEDGSAGLLQRIWRLIQREIAEADPEYSTRIGLAHLTPQSFAQSYFAPRLRTDPFVWAQDNLNEVLANTKLRRTIGWRYAILRIHEAVEPIIGSLTQDDLASFIDLSRVFIDNYAAVPVETIRRVLALRAADVISLKSLGTNYQRVDTASTISFHAEDEVVLRFTTLIDARGQSALRADDLPFAGLRRLLPSGPVPFGSDFALTLASTLAQGRIYLPAAPYLLHRLPFSQGITASAAMGQAVADAILQDENQV